MYFAVIIIMHVKNSFHMSAYMWHLQYKCRLAVIIRTLKCKVQDPAGNLSILTVS